MTQLVETRIRRKGPKNILACDGGGILGLMTVEILAKLESDLRARMGKPGLVLADFFEFVCGTSTGAIIATCIATGMATSQIRDFYTSSGAMMFEPSFITKRLRYSYDDEPLAKILQSEINRALGYGVDAPPALLGDKNLRCLLMMVMRNHTTDSPWAVTNNPRAPYNDSKRDDCNLRLPLWRLVRASTAAPTFFPPEQVVFAEGTPREYSFVFVDGGVTAYNNPAFLAFEMATASPYAINWKTGANDLLVVSVGTGSAPRARPGLKPGDLWVLDHAKNIPPALMNGASAGWDMACRIIGDCRFGGAIDREFGDGLQSSGGSGNWTGQKQFTYVRYDPDVSEDGLRTLNLSDIRPEHVQLMDSVKFMNEIRRVGVAYSAQVSLDHFSQFIQASPEAAA
jgi:patatin-like phospholipase/acyl hydrolase